MHPKVPRQYSYYLICIYICPYLKFYFFDLGNLFFFVFLSLIIPPIFFIASSSPLYLSILWFPSFTLIFILHLVLSSLTLFHLFHIVFHSQPDIYFWVFLLRERSIYVSNSLNILKNKIIIPLKIPTSLHLFYL